MSRRLNGIKTNFLLKSCCFVKINLPLSGFDIIIPFSILCSAVKKDSKIRKFNFCQFVDSLKGLNAWRINGFVFSVAGRILSSAKPHTVNLVIYNIIRLL